MVIKAENPNLRDLLQTVFTDNRARLQSLTGQELPNVTIEVARSRAHMQQRLTELNAPLWAAGLAIPSQNLVLLTAPRLLNGSQSIESLLLHELTHLYVAKALRGTRAPWWLHEGVAMLAAHENSFSHAAAFARAVFTDKLLAWPTISRPNFFPSQEQVNLAYAQAFYMTSFLEEQRPGIIAAILKDLPQGWNINRSLYELSGRTLSQWEEDFLAAMKTRFAWMAMGSVGSLWLIISLLAAVGLVWRRRHIRQQMTRMTSAYSLYVKPVRRARLGCFARQHTRRNMVGRQAGKPRLEGKSKWQ